MRNVAVLETHVRECNSCQNDSLEWKHANVRESAKIIRPREPIKSKAKKGDDAQPSTHLLQALEGLGLGSVPDAREARQLAVPVLGARVEDLLRIRQHEMRQT